MPKKTDANQQIIMDALRSIGAWCYDTHCLGRGFVDVITFYRGKYFLFEIKSGSGRLTKAEQEFRNSCPESYVVRDPDEAIKIVQYHCGER